MRRVGQTVVRDEMVTDVDDAVGGTTWSSFCVSCGEPLKCSTHTWCAYLASAWLTSRPSSWTCLLSFVGVRRERREVSLR